MALPADPGDQIRLHLTPQPYIHKTTMSCDLSTSSLTSPVHSSADRPDAAEQGTRRQSADCLIQAGSKTCLSWHACLTVMQELPLQGLLLLQPSEKPSALLPLAQRRARELCPGQGLVRAAALCGIWVHCLPEVGLAIGSLPAYTWLPCHSAATPVFHPAQCAGQTWDACSISSHPPKPSTSAAALASPVLILSSALLKNSYVERQVRTSHSTSWKTPLC